MAAAARSKASVEGSRGLISIRSVATWVSVTQTPRLYRTSAGHGFERRFPISTGCVAGLKRITEAAHGMNQPGGRGVLLDLLAQTQNIDVDGAVGDRPILPPDRVQ